MLKITLLCYVVAYTVVRTARCWYRSYFSTTSTPHILCTLHQVQMKLKHASYERSAYTRFPTCGYKSKVVQFAQTMLLCGPAADHTEGCKGLSATIVNMVSSFVTRTCRLHVRLKRVLWACDMMILLREATVHGSHRSFPSTVLRRALLQPTRSTALEHVRSHLDYAQSSLILEICAAHAWCTQQQWKPRGHARRSSARDL